MDRSLNPNVTRRRSSPQRKDPFKDPIQTASLPITIRTTTRNRHASHGRLFVSIIIIAHDDDANISSAQGWSRKTPQHWPTVWGTMRLDGFNKPILTTITDNSGTRKILRILAAALRGVPAKHPTLIPLSSWNDIVSLEFCRVVCLCLPFFAWVPPFLLCSNAYCGRGGAVGLATPQQPVLV